MKLVLEENGAEIDDDEELQLVCGAGHKLMFLLADERWTPAVSSEVWCMFDSRFLIVPGQIILSYYEMNCFPVALSF